MTNQRVVRFENVVTALSGCICPCLKSHLQSCTEVLLKHSSSVPISVDLVSMNPSNDPAAAEHVAVLARDLSTIPRPNLTPRIRVVVQLNWLNVASKFLEFSLQHPDVIDLEVMLATTEQELAHPIDLTKQVFTNFHQRYLRRREFSLHLIHPHTSAVIPLAYDSNWAEVLTAQALPRNVGLLQLEVQLSPIHVFDPNKTRQNSFFHGFPEKTDVQTCHVHFSPFLLALCEVLEEIHFRR